MRSDSPADAPQMGFFDIFNQLDSSHPLIALGHAIDWAVLEQAFAPLYSHLGRAAKPVRLMSGLLILKQLHNLSDEAVVEQWQMNPYYQVFCGETCFQTALPCHSTELVKFRQRIGEDGVKQIFARLLAQQPKGKNKIYSLHENDIHCIDKGKDHKPYEYGRKASVRCNMQVLVRQC